MVQPGLSMALHSARPVALRREWAEALPAEERRPALQQEEDARRAVPAGFRPGEARHRVRLSAAAGRRARALLLAEAEAMLAQRPAAAQRLAAPAVWAAAAVAVQEVPRAQPASAAQPRAARAEQDVAAERQPGAALAAEVLLPEAAPDAAVAVRRRAAVPDVAVVAQQPEEAPDAAEVALPPGAGAVALPPEAVRVSEAEARRRAVQGEVPAVRPLAVAWAAAHPCLQELA
jgi:hypothetical protein